MSKQRSRVCLQDGLKLDLNRLARRGFIGFGLRTAACGLAWHHSYWGEIASGTIEADMRDPHDGWLRIELGSFVQRITLMSRPRHFGGRQWFFVCPVRNRKATVLWKPPGASRFCSRQTWGRQVAYHSQFQDPNGRAHLGKERVKSRLIAGLDPDEWDLPPKPKWMRWRTYQRYERIFDHYENMLDRNLWSLAQRFGLPL
ncbi:MAG: hypothetical protein QHD01_16240 [Bradyrhizobium sp.]|uniref:hypothetical protein n=1 Tax=Bradyrhizobium sp. TaxID=376 RepID=UPI0029A676E2|nr:hypothetical protein [Bradyrhizobium sp.]MDX3968133.1 hypothetical protein [Bradyrhizobium sp.]